MRNARHSVVASCALLGAAAIFSCKGKAASDQSQVTPSEDANAGAAGDAGGDLLSDVAEASIGADAEAGVPCSQDCWRKTPGPNLLATEVGEYPASARTTAGIVVYGGRYRSMQYEKAVVAGAMYEVNAGTWRVIGKGGGECLCKSQYAWTGSMLLLPNSMYDPIADKWTDTAKLSGYTGWPGQLVFASNVGVFLGGKDPNGACGAIYAPVKDAWTGIQPPDSSACRSDALVLSIGARVFVWGGTLEGNSAVNTGWLYDPSTDKWTKTATKGAPSARAKPSGLWTGSEVIVWEPSTFGAGDSAAYDPISDTWRPMASPGPELDPGKLSTVLPIPAWGDDRMYVWDGNIQKGAVYDVANDEWTMMSDIGSPPRRPNPAVVWTGSELMVWGGRYLYGETNESWLYRPSPAKK